MTSPLVTPFTLHRLTMPNRWLTLAVAFGLSSCSGPAASGASSTDSTSLTEFADQFARAQLAKDGAALERMVHDLVFITSSGERQGKAEFIAGWIAPGDTFEPITLVDRVVVPLGRDVGW